MAKHVFRIFVSSTFNDLKEERNALQAKVFPRLRELCEQNGAQFQPIDLRWGVSDEASLDQQAMQICLNEIARCQHTSPRPNFIVLLGDRYGWMPPSARISDHIFQKILKYVSDEERILLQKHYSLDENALEPEQRLNPREKGGPYEKYENWEPVEKNLQAILSEAAKNLKLEDELILPFISSATHQEIQSGALKQTDAREHVFCFFRNIQGLPQEFHILDFQKELTARIAEEYPGGLDELCQKLVEDVLKMHADVSASELDIHLKHELRIIPAATEAETLLKLIRQVLIDYSAADFINMDVDWGIDRNARDQLAALKEELEEGLGEHVFQYQTQWTGRAISSDHIDQLCEDVYQSLANVIRDEIKNPHELIDRGRKQIHIKPFMTLNEEGLAHHQFAEQRLEFFVGREEILKEISMYIQRDEPKILAITAGGGAGKSALMAKAVEQAQAANPSAQLVYRFIGATPSSSDGRSLLDGLCREISRCYGTDESDISTDFRDLVPELGKRMSLASVEKPLTLFLDSTDQLSLNHGARSLNWLPNVLPEHVRLVVSTRDEEDTFVHLMSKEPIHLILVGLEATDGEALLGLWLKNVGRKLQKEQQKEVLDKFKESNGNPLYLKLAFEEARLWTSFQDQEYLMVGVEGIIQHNMLDRLKNEGNHGEVLVSHALGYLAASRFGLAEDELIDLLSCDLTVYTWFFRQTYHLPPDLVALAVKHLADHPQGEKDVRWRSTDDTERTALAWLKQDRNPPEPVVAFLKSVLNKSDGPRLPIVMWSRLSFDLAPYLSERMVDGSVLLSFFHRELGDVSHAAFLSGNHTQVIHEKLADYFRFKADPRGDSSWSGGNRHALSELPFHLTEAGHQNAVFETLTDFKFLEHKAEEVGITSSVDEFGREQIQSDGVHQLLQDYRLAQAAFYGGSADEFDGERAPLIRTAEEKGGVLQVYCPVCNHKSTIDRDLLGQVINCPQEGCAARLKLNTFTIQMA